ncbi:family 75 glycoside hydrolase [Thelonectria olida]|uniref:Endo-chitosanase n=1 Tax=Thelonectria olida TaxID=1576542 RepID=A0A9P8W4D5_9HYPO|nr:family 75 glycoside hydrolase [Thelonectria olida]
MPALKTLAASLLLAGLANARDVPTNVKNFKASILAQAKCNKPLATGFYSSDSEGAKTTYCGDHVSDYNVIYLQGPSGKLANMDIDCDGIQGSSADDGRCGSSGDTQSQTSFMDIVASYGQGQKDLDANVHPYVVFGNVGTKKGYTNFNPQSYGIKPLSVMAVVCGDKLIYGVWGDENGDDGAHPMVGEASISLATACFGKSMNGNNGHDVSDVLYIAFPGADAVPGKSALWNAKTYDKFEASITALGDKLIQRIGTSSGGGGGSTPNCSWAGHCTGATCATNDDCSDDLVCKNKKCAAP